MPRAPPAESVGVMRPVLVNALLPSEVTVGRLPPGKEPLAPMLWPGRPEAPDTEPLGTPGALPEKDGAPGADALPGTPPLAPDVGTKTTTPLNGEPVAMPAELVGVMSPVEVKGEATLVATEVIVGRPVAESPPVVGTKMMTPLNGDPVALPAELVSVIRPVEVKALFPAV